MQPMESHKCSTCGWERMFKKVRVQGEVYEECTVCHAHRPRVDTIRELNMGNMLMVALLSLALAPAAYARCGETPCFNDQDQHIPAYLMRMARAAEDDRLAKFFRKLGCWSGGDEITGEIICKAEGGDVTYLWKRSPDYQAEGIIMFMADPHARHASAR